MIQMPITIDLPAATVRQLEVTARQQKRTVPDLVQEIVLHQVARLPLLPDDVEVELAAFANLSDDVLWLLARSTLSPQEQEELAELNRLASERPLTASQIFRQQELVEYFDRVLVRRAQAAHLLMQRGYDLSDPATLQQP